MKWKKKHSNVLNMIPDDSFTHPIFCFSIPPGHVDVSRIISATAYTSTLESILSFPFSSASNEVNYNPLDNFDLDLPIPKPRSLCLTDLMKGRSKCFKWAKPRGIASRVVLLGLGWGILASCLFYWIMRPINPVDLALLSAELGPGPYIMRPDRSMRNCKQTNLKIPLPVINGGQHEVNTPRWDVQSILHTYFLLLAGLLSTSLSLVLVCQPQIVRVTLAGNWQVPITFWWELKACR